MLEPLHRIGTIARLAGVPVPTLRVWESRYQAFLQQKKALGATGATDMNAQVEALLRQHYSDEELLAARAYDRARHP